MKRHGMLSALTVALVACGACTEGTHDGDPPVPSSLRASVELTAVRQDCMPMIAEGEDRLHLEGSLRGTDEAVTIVGAELVKDDRSSIYSLRVVPIESSRRATGEWLVRFENVPGSRRPSECLIQEWRAKVRLRLMVEWQGRAYLLESPAIEGDFTS
jgi:hypothetical protein